MARYKVIKPKDRKPEDNTVTLALETLVTMQEKGVDPDIPAAEAVKFLIAHAGRTKNYDPILDYLQNHAELNDRERGVWTLFDGSVFDLEKACGEVA